MTLSHLLEKQMCIFIWTKLCRKNIAQNPIIFQNKICFFLNTHNSLYLHQNKNVNQFAQNNSASSVSFKKQTLSKYWARHRKDVTDTDSVKVISLHLEALGELDLGIHFTSWNLCSDLQITTQSQGLLC